MGIKIFEASILRLFESEIPMGNAIAKAAMSFMKPDARDMMVSSNISGKIGRLSNLISPSDILSSNPVFCNPLDMIRADATVITAGLENPRKSSSNLIIPEIPRLRSIITAIISYLNLYQANIIIPNNRRPKIIAIWKYSNYVHNLWDIGLYIIKFIFLGYSSNINCSIRLYTHFFV